MAVRGRFEVISEFTREIVTSIGQINLCSPGKIREFKTPTTVATAMVEDVFFFFNFFVYFINPYTAQFLFVLRRPA